MLIKHFLSLLAGGFLSCNIFAQELNTEGLLIAPLEAEWPSPEALSFLDNELDKYNFFCANEYHRSAMALEQKIAFITYLKKNKGLDKLVIEFTYVYGYWVNKYLETGDTTLLRTVTNKAWSFDKFKKNLPISHDSYSFFKWLYTFNQQYEQGVRVSAIDLDEMNHATLELWSIKQFLLKDSLFTKFTQSYSLLIKIADEDKPNLGKVKKWYLAFKEELEKNKITVEKVLEPEYVEFNNILLGIVDVIERDSAKNTRIQREKVLIRNFKREIKPTDIIYAQFGAGHIFLNYKLLSQDYMMTAIGKLAAYSGRTLSINIHCEKCELGKSRTAYKPYVLMKDDTKGYWWHIGLGHSVLNDEDHDLIMEELNNANSVLDIRNAKGKLLKLAQRYQFLVVVF